MAVAMISMRIKKFHKRTGRKLQFDTKDPVGFDKTKVECFNCHKMRYFARDCRAKGNQDSRRRDVGYNGNKTRDKEDAQNYAIMAYSSSNSSSDNESVFMNKKCDLEDTPVNDRYAEGMHAVPSPMTGNYMPSGPDVEINYSEFTYETTTSMPAPVEEAPKVVSEPKVWTDAPIIEEYESDSDDDSVSNVQEEKQKPSFAFTNTAKHVKTSRENVKEIRRPNHCPKVENQGRNSHIRKGLGYAFTRKSCFVCGSFSHLIRYCDFHEKRMAKQVELATSRNKDDPHKALKDKGIVDSGCSRHMTRNKAYLADYQEFNDGSIAFEGSNGRIIGKGRIKAGRLNFEDVYYVEQLKHYNLFSVSQMCDKKNTVLFTDTDCLVLSPNFKLPDENQVLLKIPRQHNMYSFNLKNIDPSRDLSCLFAKASIDESNKWHRRQGHVNFKNLNKLVKGNLVRGLPFKIFENDHTCVACQKGKQHKASCKAKTVNFMIQPLQILHMDLFGPTSVRSINHKTYCLVITNGFSSAVGPSRALNNDEPLYPNDPLMPHREDIYASPIEGIFTDLSYDDEGVVTDFNNLETTMNVSPTPTTRIHTIHPKTQILGDPLSAVQTRSKVHNNSEARALVGILIDFPFRKKAIRTKWFYRNKKDERGVIVRDKARLVAQGHQQEERIDYDEVFVPVARIEAIRIFLAFASYMGFIVYQMDVKSAFLYGTIDEEVYVTQPPGFLDPKFPNKVYKVMKDLYGLHQASRACYAHFSTFLEKSGYRRGAIDKTFVKTASTPIETQKPLVKDEEAANVDVHLYRSMIGSLMYLATSRPDIMFAVCACSRFHVTPKTSHLQVVKRIFRRLISWQCKKQTIMATSTIEAEYVAAAHCSTLVKEMLLEVTTAKHSNEALAIPENTTNELARMGYEKPPPKLTFYKAFFSAKWKFLIHTLVQCLSAKRTAWNKFSCSMASAVICLATVFITNQVDDLSSHITKYTSPALTQKVFANMRRIGKGFYGIETPLFATMLVQPQTAAKEEDEEDEVPSAPTPPSLLMNQHHLHRNILRRLEEKDEVNAAANEVNAVEPTVFDDKEVTMTMAQTLIKMKATKARLLDKQMAKRLHDKEVEQARAREKQKQDNFKRAQELQQ
nr:ribonuclease H-like domain-containing protein [Tanacetum cinerariifolium]